ncbi:MAG: hypothetical protein KDD11_22160 [Acidobacteria bacterium]|nr:hypothetical protein [Acidobacteriota bacterium]
MEDDVAHDSHSTTLEAFVAQHQPLVWNTRSEMLLKRWFEWPPDIFALALLILRATGAYRRATSPPTHRNQNNGEHGGADKKLRADEANGNDEPWPPPEWPNTARDLSADWVQWITQKSDREHPLQREFIDRLWDLRKEKLDHLYDCQTEKAWELCRLLLSLVSIADEAMCGVGLGFSPWASSDQVRPKTSDMRSRGNAKFFLQANCLLTLRGSLSRLPKYAGIVLPKSRTPQIGLTPRVFSNNLTFHQTEVDIAWRAFPWQNTDENIVNIMVVPWPFEVEATAFQPTDPMAGAISGQARYFHYKPSKEKSLDVDLLLEAVRRVRNEVRRVHVIVFPECAMTRHDLTRLKRRLEAFIYPSEMPMIVTGMSGQFRDEANGSSVDEEVVYHWQVEHQTRALNRVFLSLYYAGRWHDVVQDKHHRWRLDGSQIEQYSLGGFLTTGRTWWEAIQIVRRRLSVLAANSWLTICPLICEDLARLDPVSELIRGIGPSLLISILLDGPQLRERWSARYASVFADDPGSSVLTLTALGMSQRSTPRGALTSDAREKARDASSTVALWKDREKSWYPVAMGAKSVPIKILTLSAHLKGEASFDGRIDNESSASFALQGVVEDIIPGTYEEFCLWKEDQKAAAEETRKVQEAKEREDDTSDEWPSGRLGKEDKDFPTSNQPEDQVTSDQDSEEEEKGVDAERKKRKGLDMCELALFTYYVNAVVDSTTDPTEIRHWFDQAIPFDHPSPKKEDLESELMGFMFHSIEKRDLVPRQVPTPHLSLAIDIVTEIVRVVKQDFGESLASLQGRALQDALIDYWGRLQASGRECMEKELKGMSLDLSSWSKGKKWHPNGLERRALREAKVLNTNLEKRKRAGGGISVEIRPHDIGRIRLQTPLAIFWAIHVRLSARRRFGLLTGKEIELLKEVEKDAHGKSYHGIYLNWRYEMKERYRRSDN